MPVRSVIFDVIGRDRVSPAFMSAAKSAEIAAGRVDRAIGRWNRRAESMRAVGASMTKHLTLPIIAVGAVAVKSAADFEGAMTRVRTQAGGSARDVQVLSQRVLDLAKYSEHGPQQLAEAMYHLKSVGLDNVGAMRALRTATDFAAVGGANLEDTTNALAGAWRTGIRGATDFHTAAATLNAVIGAGNMRMGDLVEALSTGILPSAKTFGLTLKDVGSALAVFTDESVPANVAATRLRMAFSLLGAPSKAAEKQLKRIHLTGLTLAQDMRKPNGLIRAIGDLKSHIEDPRFHLSLAKQAQLLSHAFGGGRSSSAILSLINNFDVLKRKQNQVTHSIGRYDQAVKTQRGTSQAKFALLVSSLQRAAIILGNELLPGVVKVAGWVGDLVEKFNNMSPAMQTAAKWVLLIGAGLGPAVWLVSRLTRGFVLLFTAGLAITRFVQGLTLMNVGLATMETQSWKTGFALRASMTQASSAMGLLKAGMMGIAVGVTAGMITRGMSTQAKVIGALGAAAAGALIGLSMGGPAGAAIGGLAGGLSSLIVSFTGASNAATAMDKIVTSALKDQDDAMQALLGTLQSVNGAMGEQYQMELAQRADKAGLLGTPVTLGLSPRQIGLAVRGNTKMEQLFDSTLRAARDSGKIGNDEYTKLTMSLAGLVIAGSNAEKSFQLQNEFLGKSRVPVKALKNGYKELRRELHGTVRSLYGTGASTERNIAVIQEHASALHNEAQQQLNSGKSARRVGIWLLGQRAALIKNLVALGLNSAEVSTLVGKYATMPKRKTTKIVIDHTEAQRRIDAIQAKIDSIKQNRVPGLNADTKRAHDEIDALQARIDALRGKTVWINERTLRYASTNTRPGGNVVAPQARGGVVGDGYFSVGEEGGSGGWELGYKRGGLVRIWSNAQSRAMTGTSHAPGYAGGSGSPMPNRQIVGGKVELDADSQGRLFMRFRDLILDELDYHAQLGGMS